ncbi:MAG: hypothetical protein A2252_11580 [Elusimicrobia bacterium RIFOXYA2_FULL_39_19]|nr:MAG: hypothetical protein A2252_11580 [Elusimicrobia bacterium RIFOXYA2_FULL_39_19]
MDEQYMVNKQKFSKYFLLVVFVLSSLLFLSLIRYFFLQVMLAIIIAILIYPVNKYLLKVTKNKAGLSSLICCIIVLLVIFFPLIMISQIILAQSIELYHNAGPRIIEIIQKFNEGYLGKMLNNPLNNWLLEHDIILEWQSIIQKTFNMLSSSFAVLVSNTSKLTVELLFSFFIIMFSLFYLLRDGEKMLVKIKEVVPLNDDYKNTIVTRFYTMTNATVKGVLFIALIQGSLATFVLWVFGIKIWLLLGIVMFVFAVIPFVGIGAVLVPTGIIKIISGDLVQGIAIISISIFFISLIDNVLRPRIVGYHAGMHDLLVFFSMLGGIMTFGPAGFLIGPIIAAVFLSILEMYKLEFLQKAELTDTKNSSS